jgi:hypothetical protein
MDEIDGNGNGSSIISWFRRPRGPLIDSLPSRKVVLALWLFPYVCLGLIVWWLLGGPEPVALLLLSSFALTALIETMYFILWLRRPVDGRAER